ncbi:MAG: hypothetical protein JSV46_12225 [Candidatus Aminicenantes bacterium]|nr:MAG: hypothetical protein JSV46_12225 [Candidatus Aminicenantes bacterium]
MIDSISGLLRDVINFLGGLTILDFIFLGLFLVIYLWMLFTHKKVKRVISDPLKKYDKEVKKKQDELDREKAAIRAFANKEIKKVEEVRAEMKAQFEKEIEALKGIKIEKEAEPKAEARARARVEEEIEAEKAMKVEEVEEKVIAEREVQIEPEEEAVKEIPVEEEVKAEPALEPEPEAPIEKEIQAEKEEPEEEPKKAPKKSAKKEKPSKLTSEQYFILSAIADEPDKTYQEEAMYKIFKMAFSDREKEDFDQDVKKLEKLNYIVLEKPSGYRVWLKITDKGLTHYRDTEGK